MSKQDKDIVIFVNAIRPATFAALRRYEKETGRHFTPIVLADKVIKESIFERNGQYRLPEKVEVREADFDSPHEVREAVADIADRIFAVTSQYENCVHDLQKLVPYFPYLNMPTESSLIWGTEKKLMRNLLHSYDKNLVPGYLEVSDTKPATIRKIEKELDYPMIVKPSGLEGSLLVTRVNDSTELEQTLTRTLEAVQASYDEWVKRQKPIVLVEEFMIGKKYVMDTYVGADGTCHFMPIIASVRGIEVGFDDFFEYSATVPYELSDEEVSAAEECVQRSCNALGFRSVTADVEMMHTEKGWKIIELTARMGGYCHDMYGRSHDINHIVNDIRIRGGETPEVPRETQNHVAWFEIYAREEGTLDRIEGLETVKALPSFSQLNQNIQIGEPALFAKHGGDWVFDIILSHPDKEQLKKDIAVLENDLQLYVR